MAWKWLRNPTLANGLVTTYVSHKGNDTTGDGTAQKPYKTIAKATSEATAGTNIMLDDGIWSQQRTLNNRAFRWWGNGRTEINSNITTLSMYGNEDFSFLHMKLTNYLIPQERNFRIFYCVMENVESFLCYWGESDIFYAKNSLILNCNINGHSNYVSCQLENSLIIGGSNSFSTTSLQSYIRNCIFTGTINATKHSGVKCDYNNYTTLAIPTTNGANSHSINNASTGKTVADYFNNPALGDYTAKAGSANLGAGYQKHDIGFSLGLTFYATDSVFTEAGGATLRNVIYENECFKIAQRDKAVASATSTSITLYTDASAVDDYYNGLIIGIISGTGAGQMRTITDYDGTTKKATVDEWDTTPDTTSRYTITGLIISAQKDFGKSYKIAKNYLFANFGYNELSPSVWTEFVAINPLVSSFGLKYSDFDDLSSRSWVYFGANGQTLYDGTYGDANNSYTFANGKPIHMRYAQLQIPLIFQFE